MLVDQMLMMIISMYKTFIVIVVCLALSLSLLYLISKRSKNGSRLLNICSVFSNLSTMNKLRVSFSFLKLFCVLGYLIEFKQFDLIHIMFLALIIIIGVLIELPYMFAFRSLIYDAVLMIGIVLINALQSYRAQIYSKTGFTIIIVATSIFVFVYEIYRFVEELNGIIIRREKEYEEKKTSRN